MTSQAPSYHGYRFPPEIISYAVWLYYRFDLSFRDVEDLLGHCQAWSSVLSAPDGPLLHPKAAAQQHER